LRDARGRIRNVSKHSVDELRQVDARGRRIHVPLRARESKAGAICRPGWVLLATSPSRRNRRLFRKIISASRANEHRSREARSWQKLRRREREGARRPARHPQAIRSSSVKCYPRAQTRDNHKRETIIKWISARVRSCWILLAYRDRMERLRSDVH
jgi:hypothetical protein